MSTARIKINIEIGEVEIEGSEDFVNSHVDNLEDIFKHIEMRRSPIVNEVPQTNIEIENTSTESEILAVKPSLSVPDTFGEWMLHFKDELNDQGKVLITAFYLQKKSKTNDFKTKQVSDALKEHGIKIANTSTNLTRLTSKKAIFQTRKDGNLKFFRVSKDGEKELEKLLRKI